jgi:hypothetical protein
MLLVPANAAYASPGAQSPAFVQLDPLPPAPVGMH